MNRANPFGDLGDFGPQPTPKPVPEAAIEEISETSGFPSRKAQTDRSRDGNIGKPETKSAAPARAPRRRTTGRNRQINIKATEETIEALYRASDLLDLPLGAVLEMALEALEDRMRPA